MNAAKRVLVMATALVLTSSHAHTQTGANAPKQSANQTQVFYLTNTSNPTEAQDILNLMRSMLDHEDKVYLIYAQNALFVQAPPDQLALAKKLLDDLDHSRKTYRLIYTVTELDDGKRVGTQHFSMVVVSSQRTTLKQGSKVPVATGTSSATGSPSTQTQFTYLDVGLNLDATLDEFSNSVQLRTKVEQSSLGADKSIAGIQEPVVRQTVLEGTSILTPGKPLILGSLDIPDSTRRLDIEVVMEVVK